MLFSRGLKSSALLILCPSSILLYSQTTCAPAGSTHVMPAWQVEQYNVINYENLFRYMCIEDHLIQEHSKAENGLPLSRTDYSSAIGISDGAEQVMLNIILDGCDKQLKESKDTILDYYAKISETRFDVLKQTWLQLHQSLTPTEFQGLDAYINKNFAVPRYPDQPDSRRKSMTLEFEVFIEDMYNQDIENRRLIASGQKVRQLDYSREANFPEEKEQAVLAIVLDAGRQLSENERNIEEAVDASCGHKPPVNLNCFNAPELPALHAKRSLIVAKAVSRLKLELGEESFDNLDKWISQTRFMGR